MEVFQGCDLLFNPEEYVDSGHALSILNKDQGYISEEEEMFVWTHIRSKVSQDLYHVEQDWVWQQKSD